MTTFLAVGLLLLVPCVVAIPKFHPRNQALQSESGIVLIPEPTSMVYGTGSVAFGENCKIIYSDGSLAAAANELAVDLKNLKGLTIPVVSGSTAEPCSVFLVLDPSVSDAIEVAGADDGYTGLEDGSYNLTSVANGAITITGASNVGVIHGTVTLVQMLVTADPSAIPAVTILDKPFRRWRGLSIDTNTGNPHSIDDLKTYIDLLRYYKMTVLTFNTGRAQWMGMVMDSISQMNSTYRKGGNPNCYGGACQFYAKEEVLDLITYGLKRGVGVIPYAQCTPSDSILITALQHKFNPDSQYADFMDEIDHLGPSTFNGTADDRFWNFMKVMKQRMVSLFQQGWPNNKLPAYHVGPVLGEGGMGDVQAKQFYDILHAIDPDMKMQFWNGLCATCQDDTHPLYPVRDNLLVNFYTKDYSYSDIFGYVQSGWHLLNTAWTPMYVLGPRSSAHVTQSGKAPLMNELVAEDDTAIPDEPEGNGPWTLFDTWTEFNYFRTGTPTNGLDITKVRWDNYEDPATNHLTHGAELATWNMALPVELAFVRIRLAALAERSWNYKPYPYAPISNNFSTLKGEDGSTNLNCETLSDKSQCDQVCASFACRIGDAQGLCGSTAPPYNRPCNGDDLMKKCLTIDGCNAVNSNGYVKDSTTYVSAQNDSVILYWRQPGNVSDVFLPWRAKLDVIDAAVDSVSTHVAKPTPPAGTVYGGRLFFGTRVATDMLSLTNDMGIKGADETCAIFGGGSKWKAMLTDETGCNGQPCRRATINPYKGDGQVDWVFKPNAAYYRMDNATLIGTTNATSLLVFPLAAEVGGPGNFLSSMNKDWQTMGTCDSYTCGLSAASRNCTKTDMMGVGWGSALDGAFLDGGYVSCNSNYFLCVEQA